MFKQFGVASWREVVRADPAGEAVAQSGVLDALVALERIGVRCSFERNAEIYAQGDLPDSWYRVVSGAVRVCKLLADGRRNIAEFCFAGDCFGLDSESERSFSAEAIGNVVLMRYPVSATKRLIDEAPQLARHICDMTLRDLAHAHNWMLLLGRMTATERVANFLLEISERRDTQRALDLPMSRIDIADYLGLTLETVSRTLSAFRRAGTIAMPSPQRIELRDRAVLAAACEA